VLRTAGETETTQENIQDQLELDERDPGFQLLVFLQFFNNVCTVIFILSALPVLFTASVV
jgi:hypothetical protein